MRSSVEPRERAVDLGGSPGPVVLASAADLDVDALSEEALLDAVAQVEASLAWAAAVRARLIAAYASRGRCTIRSSDELLEMEWHREQLAAACSTSPYEAQVRCETALALRDRLPGTAAALAGGALPWAQAVVLARESEGLDDRESSLVERTVLADPRAVAVAQVRDATRAAVAALRPGRLEDEARTAYAARGLRIWPDRELPGAAVLHARLTLDAAAGIGAALEALSRPDGADDQRTAEQRRADALADLCAGVAPEQPVALQLLVRPVAGGALLSAAAGGGALGAGVLSGNGPFASEPVSAQVARRLGCGADVSVHPVDRAGRVGAVIAEARRTPGAAMRRRLEVRDGGCRFPGCPVRAPRCHAHHLRHWADGGPTIDDNLVLLCSRHHHAAHEGGWALAGTALDITWTDRDGRRYEQPPRTASVRPWASDPPVGPPALPATLATELATGDPDPPL